MPRIADVDYRKLDSYKPLFLDYLHRYERLSPFFAADPYEASSWKSVAASLDGGGHPRADVTSALAKLNRELEADESALASVEALGDGALAVVTGQQVGLLGGPLYTLYKALSAVRLARWAEELLGRRVVPLFWMDADDHDFDEVRRAYVVDGSHQLVELGYSDADESARIPVGSRTLGDGIAELLETLRATLPESEFKADVAAALERCYRPGRTLSQAFGSWLLTLTRGTGLAVVDPTLGELKAVAGSLFEREADEESRSSEIVRATTENLVSLGYHEQASPTDGHLNLFYSSPARHAVSFGKRGRHHGGWGLSGDGARLSKSDVLRRIREEPECFSPNVLLRPIYQDTLLPTLAYVAGPNELAYFAQLGDVYRHFGVSMPLIASRTSLTIVERPQARFLERYAVDLARLNTDDESLLNEILKELTPPQLDEDLTRARSCIQDITKALERDLSRVDPTLAPSVKSTRGKLLHHLEELESKARRGVKRKNETVRNQFFATRTALFPGFTLQERKLSPTGYVVKYGWHLSKLVEDSADPARKAHALLYP